MSKSKQDKPWVPNIHRGRKPLCGDRENHPSLYLPVMEESQFNGMRVVSEGECCRKGLVANPTCIRCSKYTSCLDELRFKSEDKMLTSLHKHEKNLEAMLATVQELQLVYIKEIIRRKRALNLA